jgi:hypothetical protein
LVGPPLARSEGPAFQSPGRSALEALTASHAHQPRGLFASVPCSCLGFDFIEIAIGIGIEFWVPVGLPVFSDAVLCRPSRGSWFLDLWTQGSGPGLRRDLLPGL